MADIDILSLPVAPGLGGGEYAPIVQGGVNKRTLLQAIANLAIVPSAVTWKQQCAAGTVEALPANTYDNGFGGVGATLTATTNGTLVVDGYAASADDRILVKDETSAANNGIYAVTNAGDGSAPWVLTRAIDFDSIDNIDAGDACQITGGSTLAATFWIEVAVPSSIGSSPLIFAQLFLQYTAGNGIEISGASIAIDPAVVATLTAAQTLLNKTLISPVITGIVPNAILATDGAGTIEAASTTGTGSIVLDDSPTLVTPDLGVPSFIDLTNAINLPPGSLPTGAAGLPIVGNGTGTPASFQQVPISTGVGGLAAGIAAFLGTASSANLASAVSDETGSGPLVFGTSPTLVSPSLGTPTSIVLTNGTGLPISSGVSGLGTGVATFLGTPSSANLAAAVTDETGTGALVFANSPALTGAPTAPTASLGDNTTKIATTAFVLANGSGGATPVANRTALAALSTSKVIAWLEEAGRQGMFQWNAANLSTQVTADTQQGIYVAPSSDPTGAGGAWVRQYSGPPSAAWFGFVPGTGTDAQLACAIAVAALQVVKVLSIEGGDYTGLLTQADFSLLDGINLLGNIVFDYSSATTIGNFSLGGFINIVGGGGNLTALPALASDVAAESESFTFATDPGLSKGDIIVAYNPTDYSYSGFRTYYRAGEYAEVSDPSATPVIYRFGGAFAAYTAASMAMYKHPAKTFTISGPGTLKIIESTNSALANVAGVKASLCAHIDLHKFQPTNSGYAGIYFDRCYDIFGDGYKVNQDRFDAGSVTYYGVVIGNSQQVNISGDFYGGRHAVTCGGADLAGAVPCRNGIIRGNFANSYQATFTTTSVEMHGNTEYWLYDGNMQGGATLAGNHNAVHGNLRTHAVQNGVAIEFAEMSGCDHRVSGRIYTNGIPHANASSRAVIDIGANSTGALTANTVYGGVLDFRGLVFEAPHADYLISIRNRGYVGTDPIIVDVSGAKWLKSDAAAPLAILLDHPSGNAIDELRMSDFDNGPNGQYSVTVGKIRGWRAAGTTTVTPTTSESSVTASVTFSQQAPATPVVVTGLVNAACGGSAAFGFAVSASATGVTVGAQKAQSGNFSATTAGTVSWYAMVEQN